MISRMGAGGTLLKLAALLAILPLGCSKKKSAPIATDQSSGQTDDVTFTQSSASIECYDFVEVTMHVAKPVPRDPFTNVSVSGHFNQLDQGNNLNVDGFCDSPDGTVFRVRFLPSKPGDYAYSATYRHRNFERTYSGRFKAVQGKRRGILCVDPNYPWHFIWEGSGEHCFVNGTTAFFLMGWDDEQVIRGCIDRLSRLK